MMNLIAEAAAPPPVTVRLSERQTDVLTLLARGEDVKHIARQLNISSSTCRSYVQSILTKLNAHSQLEAVIIAAQLGLVTMDPARDATTRRPALMRMVRPRASETAEVRRAVARHLVYGAVALVLVSVPTFYALGRIAEQHALDSAALDGANIARRLLAPGVTDELLAADPEAVAAMDQRLVPRMSDGSLARVKIWSIDGVVLYSDVHRLIGRNFASDLDLDELRPGGPPSRAISDLAEGENLFETEPKGWSRSTRWLPSSSRSGRGLRAVPPLVLVERERNQLVALMAPVGDARAGRARTVTAASCRRPGAQGQQHPALAHPPACPDRQGRRARAPPSRPGPAR